MTWTAHKEAKYRAELATCDVVENPPERARCANRITEICHVIERQILFVDRVAAIRRNADELIDLLKALK